MKKNNKLSVQFRVWFFVNGEKLLGKGRVELLERIQDTGSITNAAKCMNMSYRQAWQMVSEMNKYSERPLVEKQLGGKNGGGAILTEAGRNAIVIFKKLDAKIATFISEEIKKINL
ncbi:MAG: LysR family transcriptional regulator [Bacteroidetes bacterium]|nr:LysR family transcriptional regulator [Bacteroidota bacterium]